MSQPAGDLVIDLSLDAARFDEQMARVRRHFSSLEADARKTASTVEQGLSRQALAAQKAGISVGQYKAAMRTLPAQFTDIVTQLAGGQNPFLIMLQQGGQISDSFGGPLSLLSPAEGRNFSGSGMPLNHQRSRCQIRQMHWLKMPGMPVSWDDLCRWPVWRQVAGLPYWPRLLPPPGRQSRLTGPYCVH